MTVDIEIKIIRGPMLHLKSMVSVFLLYFTVRRVEYPF